MVDFSGPVQEEEHELEMPIVKRELEVSIY